LSHSPFLFGYAKPVPVNFRALREPRIGMVLVALAGPSTNILLALVAAAAFHLVGFVPANAAKWVADNLQNTVPDQRRARGLQHDADPAARPADGWRSACCRGCSRSPRPAGTVRDVDADRILILLPLAGFAVRSKS